MPSPWLPPPSGTHSFSFPGSDLARQILQTSWLGVGEAKKAFPLETPLGLGLGHIERLQEARL